VKGITRRGPGCSRSVALRERGRPTPLKGVQLTVGEKGKRRVARNSTQLLHCTAGVVQVGNKPIHDLPKPVYDSALDVPPGKNLHDAVDVIR
jgi:hypothetical protein